MLIVDVHDPSHPEAAGSIEPPPDSAVGQSSRELRVWHEGHLLIVMYMGCGSACERTSGRSTFRYYDIDGAAAAAPRLVATYVPPEEPHEFFLWQDPSDADRALLYASVLYGDPRVEVIDISDASLGEVRPVGVWRSRFRLRSPVFGFSVSPDEHARLRLLPHRQGLVILDTSEVAAGVVSPSIWESPSPDAPRWDSASLHSSVLVPGRPLLHDGRGVRAMSLGLGPRDQRACRGTSRPCSRSSASLRQRRGALRHLNHRRASTRRTIQPSPPYAVVAGTPRGSSCSRRRTPPLRSSSLGSSPNR